ncbi:hypothetical protein D3C71_1982060 [compost metagenome]
MDLFILDLVAAEPAEQLIHTLPPVLVGDPEFPDDLTQHLQIFVGMQCRPVRQAVAQYNHILA